MDHLRFGVHRGIYVSKRFHRSGHRHVEGRQDNICGIAAFSAKETTQQTNAGLSISDLHGYRRLNDCNSGRSTSFEIHRTQTCGSSSRGAARRLNAGESAWALRLRDK